MKIAWTKVVSVIFGGLILALQGINLNETTGMEQHIEDSEKNILQQMYSLEKRMAKQTEAQVARTKILMKKFNVEDPTVSPSPSPEE